MRQRQPGGRPANGVSDSAPEVQAGAGQRKAVSVTVVPEALTPAAGIRHCVRMHRGRKCREID
jgi:hypothetical protein